MLAHLGNDVADLRAAAANHFVERGCPRFRARCCSCSSAVSNARQRQSVSEAVSRVRVGDDTGPAENVGHRQLAALVHDVEHLLLDLAQRSHHLLVQD